MSTIVSMRGQRAAVCSPFRSTDVTFGGIGPVLGFPAGGLDLLCLFEPQQQLILGKRLCATTEAVTLQFLDDLHQASIFDVARQDHRLQRIRIVGKLISRDRHGRIRPYSPTPGDNGIEADSLGRGSARLHRNPGPARFMNPPPVETFEQRRQLRGRQLHHPVMHFRPAELAAL